MDDLEIQTMMEKVKKRILELEKEVKDEQLREDEAEERMNLRINNYNDVCIFII